MTCAIVCEYNPFHFGHRYQIEQLKKRFSTVVCILGGNLTQRGEVAVADRHVRAKAALACGADLVVELPLPWCCSSAREFARGGVSLAKQLGVDALAFSAESEPEALYAAAEKRKQAEAEVQALLRSESVISYPQAIERVLGKTLAGRPNDILGIEYLCACGKTLPAVILKREPSFASSGAIRAGAHPLRELPEASASVFASEQSFPWKTEAVGLFALATLRNTEQAEVYAVPPELFARMREKAKDCTDWDGFVQACTGRMYTASRVRRAAWSVTFGFPKGFSEREVPYTLLLAANENGRAFLRAHPALSQGNGLIATRRRDDPIYALNTRVNRVLRLFYGGEEANKPYLTEKE